MAFRVCSCAFARVDLVLAPCRWHGQEVTGARGGGADEPRHRVAGVGGWVNYSKGVRSIARSLLFVDTMVQIVTSVLCSRDLFYCRDS
jgi:hypothetical protein